MAGGRLPKDVDWMIIERDWRAGIKPVSVIGKEHGISHTAIGNRAKREGWTRDLGARIKAKAQEKLARREIAVSERLSSDKATEKEVVEANAEAITRLILGERADIAKARALVNRLIEEVEAGTVNRELYERLGELMEAAIAEEQGGPASRKLAEAFRKAIELPSRVASARQLVDALAKVIGLEREAFGLDRNEDRGQGIEGFLDQLPDA